MYLINLVLPHKGNAMKVADYRNRLIRMGYTFQQSIGSIGGSTTAGIITVSNGTITRI